MNIKTIMCPKCKTKFTIQGNSGEKVKITCPSCNVKGVFTFPSLTPDQKAVSVSVTIEIQGFTKNYNGVKAANNISFNVKKGEVFGFLGPNGAGKTTTIKALLGLIHKDAGSFKINGFDTVSNSIESRKNVGFLPERVSFYENLTPVQTLKFFCELKGVDKAVVPLLLKEVGLEEAKDRKVGTFSKGMVQLLGVAQVMIGNPSVYVLDEPMSGLDARWVKTIREKIKMLNEKGATIIFSSHILSEVENICHRVAIINRGRLIAEDTVSNLNKYLQIKPRLEITISNLNSKVPDFLNKVKGIASVDAKENSLYITCEPGVKGNIIAALQNSGLAIENIKSIEPSLEDAFVKLIERDA